MYVVICCFVCSDEMIVDATSNPDLEPDLTYNQQVK